MVVIEEYEAQYMGSSSGNGLDNKQAGTRNQVTPPSGAVPIDGIPDAGAPSGGSEFSPRIRRILEAQPLSPLRRAVLSGPGHSMASDNEPTAKLEVIC